MNRITTTFTADASGASISFAGSTPCTMTLDNVSLRMVTTNAVDENVSVKEFLSGNTDEGREINFRADTQILQLQTEFETFSNPIAVVTKLHRGSLVKCFVAIDGDDFYELDGSATKGTSLIKVHSKNRTDLESPPIARSVRISWRDSSTQLCRLLQGGIIFTLGTMSVSE
jgi:hypothetical protein